MGLSASQARLLTITSRKSDCEYTSMRLSHEKLALSRDMDRLSNEYEAAMSKTKLVYDYYGMGTSTMSLTYGLLMTPSVYNDYYPKILTDKSNRVVLSSTYASAARAAGIPIEGYNGTPSSEVRNKFIEGLRDLGVISAATAANIESVSYNNGIGLGNIYNANLTTQEITYADLLEIIKADCIDTKDYGVILGEALKTSATPSYPDASLSADGGNGNHYKVDVFSSNGTSQVIGSKDLGSASITLYDLLKGDNRYVISGSGDEGPNVPVCEAAIMQQIIAGTENSTSFLNWMVDQFTSILGGVGKNDAALQYAYNQVYDLVYPNENLQKQAVAWKNDGFQTKGRNDKSDYSGHGRHDAFKYINEIGHESRNCYQSNETDNVASDARDYIGFTYSACWHTRNLVSSSHHVASISIDLSTLAKVFLTAYVEHQDQEGIKNSKYSYLKGELKNAKLYKAEDDDKFIIKAPTDVTDGTENLYAGFYDALFNRICTSGWTENENIENIEYMQELMKSGAVYISSMSNDGNYYQSSYSTDTYISEVSDQEGIAQAEAKYNSEKARIENKENTLDLKMKNLDTEISSLTTEYDTVKSLISKTIEKSFKRYDA